MKTLLLAAGCSLALLHAAQADLTIVQKMEGANQNLESTTKFKDDKTRVDAGPGTSIIMNLTTGDIVNIMHAQKGYMKISGAMAQQAMEQVKKMQGAQSDKPQLVATGKKETISGYAAEEYTASVAGAKMSFWLTKALPDYQNALKQMSAAFSKGPMAAVMQGMGLDFNSFPGFPIRIVQDAGGQQVTTTVTSVSTKPVSASEFEVPAGYKEINIGALTPPAAGAPPAQ